MTNLIVCFISVSTYITTYLLVRRIRRLQNEVDGLNGMALGLRHRINLLQAESDQSKTDLSKNIRSVQFDAAVIDTMKRAKQARAIQ